MTTGGTSFLFFVSWFLIATGDGLQPKRKDGKPFRSLCFRGNAEHSPIAGRR